MMLRYLYADTAFRRLYWRDYEGQYITVPAHQRLMVRLLLPARPSFDAHDSLLVCVRAVDQVYGRYHTSLDQGGGRTVSADPQRVYSNVEQGLGVFCSYVSQQRKFAMPSLGFTSN